MPCYYPLQAFQSLVGGIPTGKPFFERKRYSDVSLKLPCGQCVGCRLERSRQWAVRCMHEASLYENNCFITLTFNDKYLPKDRSLDVRHFQLFMKRLRKQFGSGVRFYHCGEYGEKFGRPHYHACLFNFDFPDRVLWKVNNGYRLYTSKILDGLWSDPKTGESYGFTSIGDVTFESAAYVARYILKKKFGKSAWVHYADIDFETGEILGQRKPEYTTMSRRPGISSAWFDKYVSDVYPSDFVLVNGKKCKPPRYYDSLYEIQYPSDYSSIKQARLENAKKHVENNTPERLRVREQVQLARLKSLPRNLE